MGRALAASFGTADFVPRLTDWPPPSGAVSRCGDLERVLALLRE
jgi:hypothetical protein